jgi:hypothetical protein
MPTVFWRSVSSWKLPICSSTPRHLGGAQLNNAAKRSKRNSGLTAFLMQFFERSSSAIFLAFGLRAE